MQTQAINFIGANNLLVSASATTTSNVRPVELSLFLRVVVVLIAFAATLPLVVDSDTQPYLSYDHCVTRRLDRAVYEVWCVGCCVSLFV